MTFHRRALIGAFLSAGLFAGCHCPAEATSEMKLKVALFPYIPDAAGDRYKALLENLEIRFQKENPQIDLELSLAPEETAFYDEPMKMAGWLASARYDLVQTDAVLLGDLRAADVIEPWDDRPADRFFPAAVASSKLEVSPGVEKWFGIPHLMCGYFLVSASPALNSATSFDEFWTAAKATGKPVVGNLNSSWDLPALYLDALVDLGEQPKNLYFDSPLPKYDEVSNNLSRFSELCIQNGENPCVRGKDGYKSNPDQPVNLFVQGKAAAVWGYSERLHLVVSQLKKARQPIDQLRVSALPLGNSNVPLLFTDTFVKRKGCSTFASCRTASEAFAKFMNSPWAIAQVFGAEDSVKNGQAATPRYLLPAVRSAFEVKPLSTDPLYAQLKPVAEAGMAMPNNIDVFEYRRAAKAELYPALK